MFQNEGKTEVSNQSLFLKNSTLMIFNDFGIKINSNN